VRENRTHGSEGGEGVSPSRPYHGGANVWSTITADEQRGLVFLPVSTAGPDFIGVDRPGANLFVDAVVALNARTGERVWHFQTTHHDLWDYDLAAPPLLARVRHDGKDVDVVVQGTKPGFVFVLHRDSGAALFPVEEKTMPASDIDNEVSSPTQPVPSKPPALVPQQFTEQDLWDADPKHHAACLNRLRKLRNNGLYTPPSQDWTVLYPGTAGGINWSGGAFDAASGVYFVPTRNDVHLVRLNKLPEENFAKTNAKIMSSTFAALKWARTREGTGLRYGQLRDVLTINNLPCHKPPWGVLHAVDLASGEIRWQVPIGEDQRLGVRGLPNFGPPLATAGGLVFHAGTKELTLRAHDARSGEVLASFPIPAGLHAGPITYKLRPKHAQGESLGSGKQYLVIAPGGHKRLGSKLGDYIIAYTLP
jgi:quinoprotein glucose dehydrogenase